LSKIKSDPDHPIKENKQIAQTVSRAPGIAAIRKKQSIF
jgi:hypothetical protein